MTEHAKASSYLKPLLARLQRLLARVVAIYHPDNLKEKGWIWSLGVVAFTFFVFLLLISLWWDRAPDIFNVQTQAQTQADYHSEKLVTGYVTVNTTIELIERLIHKSGGYLTNDLLPPSVLMDDMPHWEWGVLQQLRDFTKALRNDISRSRTQSQEDIDLAKAEPKLNTDNQSWFWPAAEKEYQTGQAYLASYLRRLAHPKNNTAQFFARADNLRDWLEDVVKRLGSLSQRLSASVGQRRSNTDLNDTTQPQPSEVDVKTPWLQVDDVFFEARGSCYALIHLLRAIEIDFKPVLQKRNAVFILQQVIRELETTQKTVWSPMILNGTEFGIFANHSLVLSSYISRANNGIIE
ncbi:MAG: DUF2333 family protein, partial [Pseudomonadota bacterium]|nr:DUF2333 family protein [Pseudomonadota bacterium]